MTQAEAPTYSIASEGLTAVISARGAELIELKDTQGRDLLWNGDPAFWTGRSPILFPIVGRLKDDHAVVDGVAYPMRQHGIARTSAFVLIEHGDASCRLRLEANADTKRAYPFDFTLDLVYRLEGATLAIEVEVLNTGAAAMPVSAGFHPAFRWPLPDGDERSAYEIIFDQDEPGPLHPLEGGLLSSTPAPTPVEGRTLRLADELFQKDALIFLSPRSRSLVYGAAKGKALRVDFATMPQLGIWSKPGAGFVCIEPWSGYASPADFDDELSRKPGMISLGVAKTHSFSMQITLLDRRP